MHIYYYKQDLPQGDIVYFRVFTDRHPAALERIRLSLACTPTSPPQVELLEFDFSVLTQRLAYNLMVAESRPISASDYAVVFAQATREDFLLLHNGERAPMDS
jgi:hypothetical protein